MALIERLRGDRRLALGAILCAASLTVLGVGLFAVVSSIGDDPVDLPQEGTLEEILQDNVDGGGEQVAVPAPDGADAVPSGPRPTRLGIPKLYIDAPVVATGFEPGTNIPDVPKRADQVAWYDFSPTPGLNDNALFSGHVDWQTPNGSPIAAVFYRLRELQIGDRISVTLDDGSQIAYVVTGNVAAKYDDPNIIKAMNRTSADVVTLITCGGSWVIDPSKENGGNYSHRIVVRAERVA